MGTLLHQAWLPSQALLTRISPWKTHSKALLPPTPNRNFTVRSQGRGFGASVPKDKNKKPGINDIQNNQSEAKNGDDDDDEIPQEVFDRMIRRVLFYVGTPMVTGLALLYVLSLLKEHGLYDVPGWLPLTTILISFGTSGLGIGLGTLSTSWDPEVEGSLLGFEEAKKNWPVMWKEGDKR
ncbi:hypothetical protein IEQ34_005330 [Dendrobium chrysotoxum]|uniref:Protein PAM68, chloroplastic n=1 Tax=Dendrobium chrysotoxum TaxID=161865 RepID=A0AAV7HBI5_DENCH|nr:hypothetical protein IEQ34_005330 [Dendrobium chrysotoxum]